MNAQANECYLYTTTDQTERMMGTLVQAQVNFWLPEASFLNWMRTPLLYWALVAPELSTLLSAALEALEIYLTHVWLN